MKRLPVRLKTVLLFTFVFLFSFSNLIPAQAVSAASCPAGKRCIFLPLLAGAPPKPSGDLVISAVEVTQGVQDAGNGIPLVKGRSTVVRIYAQGVGGLSLATGVQFAVAANQTASALSGSPMVLTTNLKSSPRQDNYSSTINVTLPAAWLDGSYQLTVTLDPNNILPEQNEGNNVRVLPVSFTAVQPLKVMIVPVAYTHQPDGRSFPPPSRDTVSDTIRRMYPVSQVDISWHAPYAFTGDLRDVNAFSKLLSQLNGMKSSENAPADMVYYGLVPTKNASGSWFSGGVVGIGYVGHRVSLGLDYNNSGLTAAHEIGHNLGRYHAPCGSVGSPDPNYPYANAIIGAFGLDIAGGTSYSPTGGKDLMSYCSPKWISDYTYKGLFTALTRSTATMSLSQESDSQQQTLLVRAVLDPQEARFLPTYQLSGQPSIPPVESAYQIQLIGLDGQVIVDALAEEAIIASDDARSEVQARIALPDVPIQLLRLVKDGQVLAESQVRPASLAADRLMNEGQAVVEAAAGEQWVTWTKAEAAALVRFSTDGGQSWTALGIDVTGGELHLMGEVIPPDAQVEVIRAVSE
jgi:hypothetical protein